ncbi:MAG: hypothetical protein M1838_001215 [Thelocarpon superellum]|nr:MAG: hypothetical protein M1838_001215 [Thelocarpon superellum]
MASGRLAGKVALITGGSKGIGKATALRLAQDGANVVINYSSDSHAANALVEQVGSERFMAIKADAGKMVDIQRMIDETVRRFGKIDILIPNAGILLMKDLANTTEHDFDLSLELNVKGPFFLAQKAAPHMAAGSRVIFISTTLAAASTVTPSYLVYLTTKGAIEQMTRALSKDLGQRQITVNAVAPGPTATDLFLRGKPEQLIQTLANSNPHHRLGTPDDIADVMAFLSSDDSRWITGQTIRVNGGMA